VVHFRRCSTNNLTHITMISSPMEPKMYNHWAGVQVRTHAVALACQCHKFSPSDTYLERKTRTSTPTRGWRGPTTSRPPKTTPTPKLEGPGSKVKNRGGDAGNRTPETMNKAGVEETEKG
jgi:hypothetical protein